MYLYAALLAPWCTVDVAYGTAQILSPRLALSPGLALVRARARPYGVGPGGTNNCLLDDVWPHKEVARQ